MGTSRILAAAAVVFICACSGGENSNSAVVITNAGTNSSSNATMNSQVGGCDGLAEGASRCAGEEREVCTQGALVSRACPSGQTCSDGDCACDLATDGVCPTGCADDPDCASCVPDCDGKTCGPDGCAGMCGTCTGEDVCLDGNCVTPDGWCSQDCGPEDDPGAWADDGECDDGGDGGEQFCAYGTDCGDCGVREPLPISCVLNYNDDCPPDQRCDCNEDTGECFCADGARGTGQFGSDCAAQHDCASGLCLNDKCSRPCATGDDCGAPLEQCQPILGMCVAGPCEPFCTDLNRNCGSDGCGGSCGTCMGGGFCAIGTCREDTPGTVECDGVDGGECGFGESCCLSYGQNATCEERGTPRDEQCKENAGSLYQYIGCDDDSDCLGQVCCADTRKTFCADTCERSACKTDIPLGQPNGCESNERCCPIQRYSNLTGGDNDTGYCAPLQFSCL